MDSAATLETPQAPVEPQVPEAQPSAFPVDEAVLSTLSPESRQAVEPILNTWKEQMSKELEKQKTSFSSFAEKAKAFDYLAGNQKFLKWYQEQVNPQPQVQEQKPPETPQTLPPPSEQEFLEALQDPVKWQALVVRQMDSLVKNRYEPVVKAVEEKTRELELSKELDNLFLNHPDAKDMGEHLDPYLYYYTDKQGRPMEEAYRYAKAAWDRAEGKGRKVAHNTVQNAKSSVTQGPSTSTQDEGIVYVNTPEEALTAQINAKLDGKKVIYRVKRGR